MLTDHPETQADHLLTIAEQAEKVPFLFNKAIALWSNLPKNSKIMMVDDEKLNILVVAEHLKAAGYRDLIYTDDSSQALSLAGRERPDVILLDLHMPRIDGFEVLRQIRANPVLANTPVVFLTSSTDDDEKMRGLEIGATDFLHKPVHNSELLARLQNILMATAFRDHWRDYSKVLEAALRQRTEELQAARRELSACQARAGG